MSEIDRPLRAYVEGTSCPFCGFTLEYDFARNLALCVVHGDITTMEAMEANPGQVGHGRVVWPFEWDYTGGEAP